MSVSTSGIILYVGKKDNHLSEGSKPPGYVG